MTRDKIQQLAKEVWCIAGRDEMFWVGFDELERFAALVLEEGRERNLAAASEACRAFGKAGAVLMAAIRAKVSQ
jgi:hypothetical protein